MPLRIPSNLHVGLPIRIPCTPITPLSDHHPISDYRKKIRPPLPEPMTPTPTISPNLTTSATTTPLPLGARSALPTVPETVPSTSGAMYPTISKPSASKDPHRRHWHTSLQNYSITYTRQKRRHSSIRRPKRNARIEAGSKEGLEPAIRRWGMENVRLGLRDCWPVRDPLW
ncbi:hypothetical protein HOY80DRAFT_1002438 [Tuber brumale]|nr:hypothetical protein HOY80DRAFT_1002438 [Tuber brumale]